MPGIRRIAATLVHAGEISVTQRGVAVDPATAHGPIRFRLPRPDELKPPGATSA